MKKILIITAFPPCHKTAGQDYTCRLIYDLDSRGYDVDIVFFEYPNHTIDVPSSVNIIKSYKPTLMNCLKKISFNPFYTRRFNHATLNEIRCIADNYDMLYFDFSQVHIYSLFINHPQKVLMIHDVIYQKFSRCSNLVEWIKRSEKRILESNAAKYTFSNKDSQLIRNLYNVDSKPINFYLKEKCFSYEKHSVKNSFCFYGAWNRKENLESIFYFAKRVLPYIDEKEFVIIGGGMDEKTKQKLKRLGRFEFLGFVDNPIEYIAESQALIALLHYGAGVKVKVIDALTTGTPVIGTDITFEGIEDNESYPIFFHGNNEDDFCRILNDWKFVDSELKQNASNEFCARYESNHFPDLIR